MFSPDEQQIEICLLKSNLEEIENDLVIQHSTLPELDTENEQRYRETMVTLQLARSLNTEIERLKLDNVRLTAKRMQLKRESDDIAKDIESNRGTREELAKLLQHEEKEKELQIRNYEDTLEEIADRFRQTRGYYNEEEMNVEIEKIDTSIAELEEELMKQQCVVDELKRQLEGLKPELPENLLTLIGQTDFDDKVKELTNKHEALKEKINLLLNENNLNTIQSKLVK